MIVPFSKTVGIEGGVLENHHDVQNHMGSMHAGAQFTLAEAASGNYLSSLFHDKEGTYIALLRDASIKYKKQAFSQLKSEAFVSDSALDKFITSYELKGRGTIIAEVKLVDTDGDVTCVGSFKWFVQKLNQPEG